MASSLIYPHELTGRTIRLLTIESDDPRAPLRCKLSETCLDTTTTTYNALSYCWGENHSPIQINCNSQPFVVTPNLHSALLEYRHRAIQTPLWVDAVCIDQSNVSERTSQVRMMDEIYTEAECVIVWLGDAEATDGLALEFLKTIHAHWADSKDSPAMPADQEVLEYDVYLSPLVSRNSFHALATFLLRPWFSRMWIIQELLLARQVSIWCGSTTVNEEFPVLEAIARWSEMTNCVYRTQAAVKVFKDKEARRAGRFKLPCAAILFSIKHAREKGMSGILHLLMTTHWFDATDQRDRVFALVGLTSDLDKSFVDYSKSIEDVMRELSIILLDGRIEPTTGSVLDIWSSLTRKENNDITEPSWVVDFLKVQDTMHWPMMLGYPSIKPEINRKPEVLFSKGHRDEFLHVRGAGFDTITCTAPFPTYINEVEAPPDGTNDLLIISNYRDWFFRMQALMRNPNSTDSNDIYRRTGESHYEAFWRTLCCNRTCSSPLVPPHDSSGYDAFLAFLRVQELDHGHSKKKGWILGIAVAFSSALAYCFRERNWFWRFAVPLAVPFLAQSYNDAWSNDWNAAMMQLGIQQNHFESSHVGRIKGRQFAITNLGLIGLVPIAARVGDSVGFFAGCRVPYVLRRRGEGYALVGDSYMHGVMNGEGERLETEMLRIV